MYHDDVLIPPPGTQDARVAVPGHRRRPAYRRTLSRALTGAVLGGLLLTAGATPVSAARVGDGAGTADTAGAVTFTAGAATGAGTADVAGTATAAGASAEAKEPKQTNGPCAYTETPDDPAARHVPLPPDPRRLRDEGTVRVVLETNHGRIGLILDRGQAPCTVQSFLHLVQHRFYDDTICHRLTAYPTLKVLQCGDPSGTGWGGPGYRYRDELPTDLEPAPTDPTGVRRIYPRGTLAMANAGPDTNGSQFFLVYADSVLRPNYTVFGTVDEAGLATLDRVAAGGVTPTPEDPAPVDGPPALLTRILDAGRG